MVDITNKFGQIIFTYPHSDTLSFDEADFRGVNLKDAILEGANFSGAKLTRACLEGCNLYWAIFLKQICNMRI